MVLKKRSNPVLTLHSRTIVTRRLKPATWQQVRLNHQSCHSHLQYNVPHHLPNTVSV